MIIKIYLVDLGCLDVNTWASHTDRIEKPNYLWLDLDPTIPPGLKGKHYRLPNHWDLKKNIKVALDANKVLTKNKLTCFIKTSGKTDLDIYIPFSGISFNEARPIAYKIADEVHKLVSWINSSTLYYRYHAYYNFLYL